MNLDTNKIIFILKEAGVYLAIAASFVAIISYFFSLIPQRLELTIDEYQTSNPTKPSFIHGLSGEFIYNEKKVNDLYISNVRLINTGDKTIIGEGLTKNTIKDDLLLSIPDSFKIISIKKINDKQEAELTISDQNKFKVKFLQLRKGEYIPIEIVSDKLDNSNTMFSVNSNRRDLIDGDIISIDTSDEEIELIKAPKTFFNKIVITIVGFSVSLILIYLLHTVFNSSDIKNKKKFALLISFANITLLGSTVYEVTSEIKSIQYLFLSLLFIFNFYIFYRKIFSYKHNQET